jgi:hypothetical protein
VDDYQGDETSHEHPKYIFRKRKAKFPISSPSGILARAKYYSA